MQVFQFITYHVDAGVATLTLNRPDKLNSLMGAMMLEMFSALGMAAQDPLVRAVVLTGCFNRVKQVGGSFMDWHGRALKIY